MNRLLLYHTVNHKKLHKFAIFMFICILTLHGTYFQRGFSDAGPPDTDWLVIVRLLACSIGFIVGIILIPKTAKWGFGAKALLFYVFATGISAINSPYPVTVIGYFSLLLGASFLMIGLVYYSKYLVQLEQLEHIWFMTVSVLVLKDAITNLLFQILPESGDVIRLGSITHPTQLSFFAGLLFWLSFRQKRSKYSPILWLLRAFLFYVLIAAVSRGPIAAFLFGGFVFVFFRKKDPFARWREVCIGISIIFIFLLSLSFEQGWSGKIVTYMKRGQDTAGLTTFTGRTLVWRKVLNKSLESPIIGHGYGISRFTIGVVPADFSNPSNSHNEVLEVFFNTGLIGLIPFLGMLIYSLKWMMNHSRLRRSTSTDLAVHAVCVIVMLIVSSIFETRLSGRTNPIHLLFIFYLLIIDVENCLLMEKDHLFLDKKKGTK